LEYLGGILGYKSDPIDVRKAYNLAVINEEIPLPLFFQLFPINFKGKKDAKCL